MECSICKKEIDVVKHPKTKKVVWDEGHNAQPATNGRCCTSCNEDVVIPLRLKMSRKGFNNNQTEGCYFFCPKCGPFKRVIVEQWAQYSSGPNRITLIQHHKQMAIVVGDIPIKQALDGSEQLSFNFCGECGLLIPPPMENDELFNIMPKTLSINEGEENHE